MKGTLIVLAFFCFYCPGIVLSAQSVERSSGVVKLDMRKEAGRVSDEESVRVRIPMVQKPVVQMADQARGFTWLSPTVSSVKTAEGNYTIEVTINAGENIRFVNIFINDQFVRNVIPPVSTIRQMVIKEDVELALGVNDLRVEAISTSGKKEVSQVEIVYDISSATYYALVIAVEEYDDPNIVDLEQPVKDAEQFAALIGEEYTFEPGHITFMKNPTKADIIGTLHHMRSVVGPSDNLLIYYAGHGYWDEEMSTGYWLPRDARRDNPVDWLPNTDLTNYLNVLKTKHTLLIADACFSGGIFKTRAAFNDVMGIEKLYRLPSRKAITSGNLNEVPDKSVFVEYLIRRLDSNRRQYLSSEQLYSSLREAVYNNSPNVPQYGTIQNVGDEGGDFIFIRRR